VGALDPEKRKPKSLLNVFSVKTFQLYVRFITFFLQLNDEKA